jgi:hypothetical protein
VSWFVTDVNQRLLLGNSAPFRAFGSGFISESNNFLRNIRAVIDSQYILFGCSFMAQMLQSFQLWTFCILFCFAYREVQTNRTDFSRHTRIVRPCARLPCTRPSGAISALQSHRMPVRAHARAKNDELDISRPTAACCICLITCITFLPLPVRGYLLLLFLRSPRSPARRDGCNRDHDTIACEEGSWNAKVKYANLSKEMLPRHICVWFSVIGVDEVVDGDIPLRTIAAHEDGMDSCNKSSAEDLNRGVRWVWTWW